jgi:hypothetical protein
VSATAPVRPAPAPRQRPEPAATRPRLTIVPTRRSSAGRLPFYILIGAILVAGLVTVLLLHMMAAQYAFRSAGLQARLNALNDQKQQLSQLVDRDSSPTSLARRAEALGMRPSTVGSFHRLSDGRTIAQ